MIYGLPPFHATPESIKRFAKNNKLPFSNADIPLIISMVNTPDKPVKKANYNSLVIAYKILNILKFAGAGTDKNMSIGGYVARIFPMMNSGDDNKDLVFKRAVDYRMQGLFPPGIKYNMTWNQKNGELLQGKLFFIPAALSRFIIEPYDRNPHMEDDPLAWFGPMLSIVSFAVPAFGPLAFAANATGAINSGNLVNLGLAALNATGLPNSLAQSVLPDGTGTIGIKATVAGSEAVLTKGNPMVAVAASALPDLAKQGTVSLLDNSRQPAYVNFNSDRGTTNMNYNDFNFTDSVDPDSLTATEKSFLGIQNDFGQSDDIDFGKIIDTATSPGIWANPIDWNSMSSNTREFFGGKNTFGQDLDTSKNINPGQWGIFAGDLVKTATGAFVQYVAQKNAQGKQILKPQPYRATVIQKSPADSIAAAAKTYALPLVALAAFFVLRK